MRNLFTNQNRLRLNFEQKMLLRQFRVRVFITVWVMSFSSIALWLDVGIARKYGIWLTNLLSFIIGWWMPSPGTPPTINQQEIAADRAVIMQENDS